MTKFITVTDDYETSKCLARGHDLLAKTSLGRNHDAQPICIDRRVVNDVTRSGRPLADSRRASNAFAPSSPGA